MDSSTRKQQQQVSSIRSAVEEDAGVLKSGLVTAGFTPIKSKKCYYAVLCERALELHESEKSQKKKRHARHLIDLSTCFNIDRHLDSRLKYCVSVMTPDETLLLRGETDAVSDEWFDVLMSAVIPARALRLGRPVLASEFFECAWDVVLMENPKLRKPVPNPEKMPNMCKKDPSLAGPQRLCFYPHTIILCRRGIEPASIPELPPSGIPPFRVCDFVEFPRKYVASFGCQEKFFIMRMGRSSPSGSAEVWAQCESEETAADIHNKLNKIIERESEKKKQMVNGPMLRASISAGSHVHHERVHVPPVRHRMGSAGNAGMTGTELTLRERRAQLRDSKAALESFEEMESRGGRISSPGSFSGSSSTEAIRRRCSGGKPSNGPASWGSGLAMPARAHSVTGTSCTSTSAPAASVLRVAPKKSDVISEEIPRGSFHHFENRHRASLASSSAAEETEDSGGTLRIVDADERSVSSKSANDREIAATIERMLPEELKQRCALRLGHLEGGSMGGRQSECDDHNDAGSFSAGCSTSTNDEFISTTPGDTSEDASGDNLEYAPMEMNSWSSGSTSHLAVPIPFEQQYNLEEVRSYVSDSSDSCYSSLAPNAAPRTYSFGSHISQPQRHVARRHHLPDDGTSFQESIGSSSMQNGVHQRGIEPSNSLLSSQEDPRKRAFSLGSKSWFQKPFRKFSRDLASRTHRHANTSAASLASTYGAPSAHTLHPSTTNTVPPIQAYIAPDPYPYSRVRSESIGSGRSTPYTHRSGSQAVGDHVQLDFGGGIVPLGRSASGSMHSVDSPTRSRASSFGCSQRLLQSVRDPGDIVVHAVDIHDSEQPFCHPHLPSVRDKSTPLTHYQPEDGEYVRRDVRRGDDYVLSDPVFHELTGELCGCTPIASCSAVGDNQIGSVPAFTDSRSSQIFETIEENISGRSSRASTGCSDGEENKGNWSARAVKGSSASVATKELDDHCVEGESGVPDGQENNVEEMCIDKERGAAGRPIEASGINASSDCLVGGGLKRGNMRTVWQIGHKEGHRRLESRDDSDLRYVLVDLAHRSGGVHRKRSKSSSVCVGAGSPEYAQLQALTVAAPLSNKTLL
ncbi:Insulin receptor substrate 1 [Toxocara canis]|uniref:Insulin receptor substrate 1 n=1 Tax=Toxocara canis TaxID=6265 RepID=A0A0B2UYL2_TOXCA|nr:Insulin receptor substrate 1 [Toxocara canis]